jgi:hypothetical protein
MNAAPRCTRPGSPTCRLPTLAPKGQPQHDTHTCCHCGRVWRIVDRGHGPYWQHTPDSKQVTR